MAGNTSEWRKNPIWTVMAGNTSEWRKNPIWTVMAGTEEGRKTPPYMIPRGKTVPHHSSIKTFN
jgi:hypothetical protein